jgi:hypothetical protein
MKLHLRASTILLVCSAAFAQSGNVTKQLRFNGLVRAQTPGGAFEIPQPTLGVGFGSNLTLLVSGSTGETLMIPDGYRATIELVSLYLEMPTACTIQNLSLSLAAANFQGNDSASETYQLVAAKQGAMDDSFASSDYADKLAYYAVSQSVKISVEPNRGIYIGGNLRCSNRNPLTPTSKVRVVPSVQGYLTPLSDTSVSTATNQKNHFSDQAAATSR